MPIRAEYRKYYDARWRKFRLTMLEAAGNVCQMCHQPHRLLNVAHLSHDPADRTCLTVLCPRCHSKHTPAQRSPRPRRTRARQRGQLWLSDELEVAPVPVRLDRKSTRLNSSHLGISYAVFCFKKNIKGRRPWASIRYRRRRDRPATPAAVP